MRDRIRLESLQRRRPYNPLYVDASRLDFYSANHDITRAPIYYRLAYKYSASSEKFPFYSND